MICSVFSIVIVIRPTTEATDIGFVFVFLILLDLVMILGTKQNVCQDSHVRTTFICIKNIFIKKKPNVMHCSTVNHSYQHPHLQLNGIILFKVYHASLLTLEKFKFVQLQTCVMNYLGHFLISHYYPYFSNALAICHNET